MKIHHPILALFILLTLVSCRKEPPIPPPVGIIDANSLKIEISKDGFYQITIKQLRDAGVELSDLITAPINLTQAGQPVPIIVENEAIRFYGQAATNRYTNVRPYILTIGEGNEPLYIQSIQPNVVAEVESSSLRRTIHFEENHRYKSQAFTEESEITPWFWELIQVSSKAEVRVQLPAQKDGAGTIKVQLWGASTIADIEIDHDIDLYINGKNVGTIRGDGETFFQSELILPPGTLQEGENIITFDNTPEGAAFLDITFLDWLDITFEAPLQVSQDKIEGIVTHSGFLELSNFSSKPFIFDISDSTSPQLFSDWEYDSSMATLGVHAGIHLAAITPNQFQNVPALTPQRQSNWHDTTTQADMIIVTTDELMPALQPLINNHQANGLAVATIPVAEIYDEFGFGEKSPQSIQNFLSYTLDNWAAPKPQYLFIVGEATYDFRDHLGLKGKNIIPSLMVPVEFSGETVSDARMADTDGDFRPNFAVGRWPVSSVAAVTSLVARTLTYEETPAAAQAIFTADGTSEEFSNFNKNLLTQTSLPAEHVAQLTGATTSEVTNAWNEGTWLVTYTGHGSVKLWGKDEVFSSEAVTGLNGESAPIVLQFTCLSGFFADPEVSSLSETLLTSENGPVLLVGATSLTLSTSQAPFAEEMVNALQDAGIERIGDAMLAAQSTLDVQSPSLREISDTFGLFGDPAAKIMRPEYTNANVTN